MPLICGPQCSTGTFEAAIFSARLSCATVTAENFVDGSNRNCGNLFCSYTESFKELFLIRFLVQSTDTTEVLNFPNVIYEFTCLDL
jgi:hypothetical protein